MSQLSYLFLHTIKSFIELAVLVLLLCFVKKGNFFYPSDILAMFLEGDQKDHKRPKDIVLNDVFQSCKGKLPHTIKHMTSPGTG